MFLFFLFQSTALTWGGLSSYNRNMWDQAATDNYSYLHHPLGWVNSWGGLTRSMHIRWSTSFSWSLVSVIKGLRMVLSKYHLVHQRIIICTDCCLMKGVHLLFVQVSLNFCWETTLEFCNSSSNTSFLSLSKSLSSFDVHQQWNKLPRLEWMLGFTLFAGLEFLVVCLWH